jgi:hypothetical protein
MLWRNNVSLIALNISGGIYKMLAGMAITSHQVISHQSSVISHQSSVVTP